MLDAGIEDFVNSLPGVSGIYPYPLFEVMRAAPDVSLETFLNVTDRVLSGT